MDSSIEVTVNKILARTSNPMHESDPTALQVFGAGLAMGHHNIVYDRSKSCISKLDSDEDSDVSPIIATSEAPEFDIDNFVNLLGNNKSKIDFLAGYAGKLAQMGRVKEAVILANRYIYIRNSVNKYEDIITVFKKIFPRAWIDEFSDLSGVEGYNEACQKLDIGDTVEP